ncbi:MAG: methionine--tRNA ligase [Clostridia bacterium]|nr:methionine--tRNA ligase [Clostridia bacterium]MBQ8739859.1 methionine--tRNA ligase [Clostridia bacterium]
MKEKFYMTTAIAYASAKPHFGNTYEIIMADAYARYKRLRGYDVRFMTGTDEHGQKIQNLAKEAGLEPQAYVDKMSGVIKDIWGLMGSTHDHFIRTTDDYHKRAVKNIFKKLYDKGDIYKGSYKGLYCTPCESFFTETQLVDGKCPDCGREVTHAEEEAYFFKMSSYADRLMKHIEENPDFIQPESRKNEMVNNFLKPGLQDLCVSRTSFSWGIPVEFDPKHVTYVWLDALTNYITGLGYDPANEVQPELFQKYWPVDVHIIGKDIVRFHMIYWPIILMALDLPLPKRIFAHPWFMFGKDKMSKSRGNVVYADDLAKRFGVDGVRYYALSEMPYGTDGSITYESVITRYNMDLANNLGNLVSRTVSMAKKYFGGVIPAPAEETELDRDLKAKCAEAFTKMCEHMDEYRIADAVSDIFDMLSRTNKYIDETTPWVLAKNESELPRLGTVIYNLLEAIRIGAIMLSPIIPSTCKEIFRQINTDKTSFEDISFGLLSHGVRVADDATNLFQRIDEKAFFEALEKEQEAEKAPEKPEGCAIIGIDKFAEIELRTAQIIACESVPKAKKLLKLQLDLGYEKRQVVSGIAPYYKPDDLVGKKVIVVANLAPAKLCGVESQGMILASSGDTVRVVFLDSETPNGQRIS